MDAKVKIEEVTDDGQVPILIKPKQEVIDESWESIKPKVESIDEQDVKIEEIDDREYQHMIPYEYRDYVEQHSTKVPENSRKRQAEQAECQVCKKTIVIGSIRNAKNHASTHTNLKRFSCHIEECDYKSYLHHHVIKHMKQKHKMVQPNAGDVVRRELSDDEKEQFKKVMEDCFPDLTEMKTKSKGIIDESWESIEPKIDLINEQDVTIEEIDDTEYQHMIPHEYRDYLEHQEEEPVNCEPILEAPRAKHRKLMYECRICLKTVPLCRFIDAENHASTHMNLQRFECPVESCDFKSFHDFDMNDHLKSEHSIYRILAEERELTPEDNQKLRSLVNKCFPGQFGMLKPDFQHSSVSNNGTTEFYCQVCQRKVVGSHGNIEKLWWNHAKTHSISFKCEDQPTKKDDNSVSACQKCGKLLLTRRIANLKNHVANHMNFQNFSCPMSNCLFKSFRSLNVRRHIEIDHQLFSMAVEYRKLTKEEEHEMEKMMEECFPKNNSIVCQVCHQKVDCRDKFKYNHAAAHLDPQVYNCIEQDCNFSTNGITLFDAHLMSHHQKRLSLNRRKFEEREREKEVQMSLEKCFPRFRNTEPYKNEHVVRKSTTPLAKQYVYTCQTCTKEITEVSFWSKNARRNHASEHVDTMISRYKCSVVGCQFKAKYLFALNNHQATGHDTFLRNCPTKRITLAEQVRKIEKIMIECFPELNEKDSK